MEMDVSDDQLTQLTALATLSEQMTETVTEIDPEFVASVDTITENYTNLMGKLNAWIMHFATGGGQGHEDFTYADKLMASINFAMNELQQPEFRVPLQDIFYHLRQVDLYCQMIFLDIHKDIEN